MRITLRRPAAAGNHVELILGVLLLVLLPAATLLVLKLPPRLAPACWLHETTGIPCPACGSWRCLQHLLSGRLHEAWLANPLATALSLLAAGCLVYSWAVVLFRLPHVRIEGVTRRAKWVLFVLILAAVAGNWIYLLQVM